MIIVVIIIIDYYYYYLLLSLLLLYIASIVYINSLVYCAASILKDLPMDASQVPFPPSPFTVPAASSAWDISWRHWRKIYRFSMGFPVFSQSKRV